MVLLVVWCLLFADRRCLKITNLSDNAKGERARTNPFTKRQLCCSTRKIDYTLYVPLACACVCFDCQPLNQKQCYYLIETWHPMFGTELNWIVFDNIPFNTHFTLHILIYTTVEELNLEKKKNFSAQNSRRMKKANKRFHLDNKWRDSDWKLTIWSGIFPICN